MLNYILYFLKQGDISNSLMYHKAALDGKMVISKAMYLMHIPGKLFV